MELTDWQKQEEADKEVWPMAGMMGAVHGWRIDICSFDKRAKQNVNFFCGVWIGQFFCDIWRIVGFIRLRHCSWRFCNSLVGPKWWFL